MRLWTFLPLIAGLASRDLAAQPCVARSQQSIAVAVQNLAVGDSKHALPLLQEVENNCALSPVIKRKLSSIYRDILFDTAKADSLLKNAQELEHKDLQPDSKKVGLVIDKWALVVGISKFQHLEPEAQLSAPAKDARDFAATLTDPNVGRFSPDGKHVRVLTDGEATLQGVMSGVDYLSSHAQVDDLVVIYISSHGTAAKDDQYASHDGQTGYIVTFDTKPSALFSTAFAMEELKRVLSHLRAQRVIVFLDTCYSGDSIRVASQQKGTKALSVIQDAEFEKVVQGTGQVLIVSSTGSQQSWEDNENSFFTKCLIAAMKEKQGLNTVTELFSKLDHDLPYLVARKKNATQTPMMWPQGQNVNIVIGTPIR